MTSPNPAALRIPSTSATAVSFHMEISWDTLLVCSCPVLESRPAKTCYLLHILSEIGLVQKLSLVDCFCLYFISVVVSLDSSPGPRYHVDAKVTRFGRMETPSYSISGRGRSTGSRGDQKTSNAGIFIYNVLGSSIWESITTAP